MCIRDSPLRTVEQYNFHSGKVKYIPPLNTPRSGLGVAVLDGKLYAVGGHDGTSYLNRLGKHAV